MAVRDANLTSNGKPPQRTYAEAQCTFRNKKRVYQRSEWPSRYILGSPGMLQQRWPKNERTGVRIILEFRNPNCIPAKEFFDHVEREIATLEMNQLRRRTSPID